MIEAIDAFFRSPTPLSVTVMVAFFLLSGWWIDGDRMDALERRIRRLEDEAFYRSNH